MPGNMSFLFWLQLLMFSLEAVSAQRTYPMDTLNNCGRTLRADDNGVQLQCRSDQAPSNPPTDCTVYVESAYMEDDGTNLLQVEVRNYQNRQDCSIDLDIFNGRGISGNYLANFGCNNPASPLYATDRKITVRLSRPDRLTTNEYQCLLLIKPWKNREALGTTKNVDVLSTGVIIGIVMGVIILVILIILFCWCYCTGRIGNKKGRKASRYAPEVVTSKPGYDNNAMTNGHKKHVIDSQEHGAWNTATSGSYDQRPSRYEPGPQAPRQYQRGGSRMGRQFDRGTTQQNQGNDYENYDDQGQRGRWQPKPKTKETNIDDVFQSDSNSVASEQTEETVDDATLQQRPTTDGGRSPKASPRSSPKGSPKSKRKGSPVNHGTPLERFLNSQPEELDMIGLVDDDDVSPGGSLRKKNKNGSPTSRRKNGREPDSTAMPPEMFEPIFTKPITGIDYQSNRNQNPYGYPGGMVPYGMMPAGAFMQQGPPGTQTYAYAYQTAPQYPGAPGQQGAYVIQNTPTAEGNRRTAFAMQQTIDPNKGKASTPDRRRKNSDPFKRNGNRSSWDSRATERVPDLAVVTRGAAPPDPGQGQRSMEMKTGTNTDTGIHTTQMTWRDTLPDASDPKPGENPQITRKTITRVTTKSGFNELPPTLDLLSGEQSDPEFLSPGGRHTPPQRSILPAASTPASDNVAFYTGANPASSRGPHSRGPISHAPSESVHSHAPPSQYAESVRSSIPNRVNHPKYNSAIRDRIPLDSDV